MNDIAAKKIRKKNPDFIKALKMVLDSFETGGDVESALLYIRSKDGSIQTTRSYSDDPESDAAALLVMALTRLGIAHE